MEVRRKVLAVAHVDELRGLRPFGEAITLGLSGARVEPDGEGGLGGRGLLLAAAAMERAAVLDLYFTDLSVERADRGHGCRRIDALPSLWG